MIMKNYLLLCMMISLTLNVSAYDIEVKNADGVTIYYNYINDLKELEVAKGFYSDNIVIPEEVVYENITRKVTSIGEKAFYNCDRLTSVIIPNSVKSIGDSAFLSCSGLTSVTIGNSVTSIGYAAFQDCTGLTSVHISDIAAWCKISFDYFSSNPLNYAQHLFLNGSEVKDLIIPNSVTSIGERAFYYCKGLTSVKIPNSVTSIGKEAFHGCFKLTTVVSLIEEPFAIKGNWTDGTFSNYKATLYVPNGTIAKYKATIGWRDFIYILEFDPSGINNVLYNERKDAPAYNLNGRRVNQPQKGIIIIDGKIIISR